MTGSQGPGSPPRAAVPKKRAIAAVNIAVLLFGMAGLFARWIHLPAMGIAFGRVLFSSSALAVFMAVRKQSFRLSERRDALRLIGAGAVLALHWWSFLRSIQLSTVAVGTITFSTFPLFVTFLEPLIFRRPLKRLNCVFAAAILAGALIAMPAFSPASRSLPGFALGMVSALSYGCLTLMNKALAGHCSGVKTAFYEQATAALLLLPLVIAEGVRPSLGQLGLLLILGVVMTAVAHTMFITSLKTIPAQLAGVCSALETVYGILFALLLLGEVPSLREVVGGAIIVCAVAAAQLSEGKQHA